MLTHARFVAIRAKDGWGVAAASFACSVAGDAIVAHAVTARTLPARLAVETYFALVTVGPTPLLGAALWGAGAGTIDA